MQDVSKQEVDANSVSSSTKEIRCCIMKPNDGISKEGFRYLPLKIFVFLTLLQLSCGADGPSSTWSTTSATSRQRPPVYSRLGRWAKGVPGELVTSFKTGIQSGISSGLGPEKTPKDNNMGQTVGSNNKNEGLEQTGDNYWLDDEQKKKEETMLIPSLARFVDSLLSDPRKLAQLSLKAVQYSLIWYLSKTLWKALNEVMEEMNSQDAGSTNDPYFCARSDVSRILLALENPNVLSLSGHSIPRNVLQLAVDLRSAGMPIRSPNQSSIETLLHTITKSEASILRQCLWKPPPGLPRDQMWNAIVGLDPVKEQLLVASAGSGTSPSPRLQRTQKAFASLLKSSSTTNQHVGILLYGEPGCGKSFLVRALAAKLRLTCLVVTPSVLMRKYVGDTNLQVRSLFSLLPKLNPCMVVLDELDGLFRERHDQEHDASRELKTEFLQWLSGIMTSGGENNEQSPLIVIGATNRPSDVDTAILRRLPQRFHVGLPDYQARCKLLHGLLSQVPVEGDLNVGHIADQLNGYTPSDIHQVLQSAVRMGPLKEALAENSGEEARPLTIFDIMNAISYTQPTPLSPRYRLALQQFANSGRSGSAYIGGESFSYADNQNGQWGPHFFNMGTIHIPASDFLRDWQDPTTSFDWDPEAEDNEQDEDDIDDDDEHDDDMQDDDDSL